jgi:hypothetical protein
MALAEGREAEEMSERVVRHESQFAAVAAAF